MHPCRTGSQGRLNNKFNYKKKKKKKSAEANYLLTTVPSMSLEKKHTYWSRLKDFISFKHIFFY